jgi:hypothetical protein
MVKGIISKIKNVALGLLVGGVLGAGVNAQDNPQEGLSGRLRSGYSGSNGSHRFETDLGIAPRGSYDGTRFDSLGQFLEIARVRDVTLIDGDSSKHYTLGGVRVPRFDSLNTDLFLNGAVGDVSGIDIESSTLIGDTNLTFDFGRGYKPSSTTHLGTGLDQRFGDVLIGFGFDRTELNGSNRDQYLVTGEVRTSPTDTFGASLTKVSDNYSLHGTWIHHNDENFGVRTFVGADWSDNGDFKNLSGQVILAQKPTTGEPGATWYIGRKISDDEAYHGSVVPLGLNVNGVSLPDRAKEGFSVLLEGNKTENSGVEFGNIRSSVGYMFSREIGSNEVGFSFGANRTFGDGIKSETSLEGGVVYRNGNFTLDSSLTVPLGGSDAFLGISGQIKF